MPGGKPWVARGTGGSGEAVAVQNRPTIAKESVSNTVSIASGGSEITEVYAPSGSTYRLLQMQLKVQPDGNATTGDHRLGVWPFGSFESMFAKSNYNTAVWWTRSHWYRGDLTAHPSSEAAAVKAKDSLGADDVAALELKYTNNTDVAQDNPREYEFVFEEVNE